MKGKAKGARRVLLRHGRPPANTGLIFALAVKHAGLDRVRPRYRDKVEMNEPGKPRQAEAARMATEEMTDGVGTTRERKMETSRCRSPVQVNEDSDSQTLTALNEGNFISFTLSSRLNLPLMTRKKLSSCLSTSAA